MTEKFFTKACALLQEALQKRFLGHVRIVTLDGAPSDGPHPSTAVYATFGMSIGLNALEHYTAAAFIHGYYVSNRALRAALYAHLRPSLRPSVDILPGRKIKLGARATDEDRRLARELLLMMEVDPVIQAAGRVRFTIHPRTVVVSCLHDLEPLLGPHIVVGTIEEARERLGLGTTKQEQVRRVARALQQGRDQGLTLAALAERHELSESWVRKVAKAVSIEFPRGRPSTQRKSGTIPPNSTIRGDCAGFPLGAGPDAEEGKGPT